MEGLDGVEEERPVELVLAIEEGTYWVRECWR